MCPPPQKMRLASFLSVGFLSQAWGTEIFTSCNTDGGHPLCVFLDDDSNFALSQSGKTLTAALDVKLSSERLSLATTDIDCGVIHQDELGAYSTLDGGNYPTGYPHAEMSAQEKEIEKVIYNAYRVGTGEDDPFAQYTAEATNGQKTKSNCYLLLSDKDSVDAATISGNAQDVKVNEWWNQDGSVLIATGGVQWDIDVTFTVNRGEIDMTAFDSGDFAASLPLADLPTQTTVGDRTLASSSSGEMLKSTTKASIVREAERHIVGDVSITAQITLKVSANLAGDVAEASYTFSHTETHRMEVEAANPGGKTLGAPTPGTIPTVTENAVSLNGERANLVYDDYYCDGVADVTDIPGETFEFALQAERLDNLVGDAGAPANLTASQAGSPICRNNKPTHIVNTALSFDLNLPPDFATQVRQQMFKQVQGGCQDNMCLGALYVTANGDQVSAPAIEFSSATIQYNQLNLVPTGLAKADTNLNLIDYFTASSTIGAVALGVDYDSTTVTQFDGTPTECATGFDPLLDPFSDYINDLVLCVINVPPDYPNVGETLSVGQNGQTFTSPSVRKMSATTKNLEVITLIADDADDKAFAFNTAEYCDQNGDAAGCVPGYQKIADDAAVIRVGATSCEALDGTPPFDCTGLQDQCAVGDNTCPLQRDYDFADTAFRVYMDQNTDPKDFQYGGSLLCATRTFLIRDSATIPTPLLFMDEDYDLSITDITFTQTEQETERATLAEMNGDCSPGPLTPGMTSTTCDVTFQAVEKGGSDWTIAQMTHTADYAGVEQYPAGLCVAKSVAYTADVSHPCEADQTSTVTKDVLFSVPVDATNDETTLEGATWTDILNPYHATDGSSTPVSVTFAQSASSSVAIYGLFDSAGDSLCTLSGGEWSCPAVQVKTTDEGIKEARKTQNRGKVQVTLDGVYVASACPTAVAEFNPLTTIDGVVGVAEYGVIRDTFSFKLYSSVDASTTALGLVAEADNIINERKWSGKVGTSTVFRVPWDENFPVMPDAEDTYTVQVESSAEIKSLTITRQPWTTKYDQQCIDTQGVDGQGGAYYPSQILPETYTPAADWIEQTSCSEDYQVQSTSGEIDTITGNTLNNDNDIRIVFKKDICDGVAFEGHASGSPFTLEMGQGASYTDTKRIILNVKCGAGDVALALMPFQGDYTFPQTQTTANQLLLEYLQEEDQLLGDVGGAAQHAYADNVPEKLIVRSPFTHIAFQVWQVGKGKETQRSFTLNVYNEQTQAYDEQGTFTTETPTGSIQTYDASSCETSKLFRIDTDVTGADGQQETESWSFRVPCVRTSAATKSKTISLDYSMTVDWSTFLRPTIQLSHGPQNKVFIQAGSEGCTEKANALDLVSATDEGTGNYLALDGTGGDFYETPGAFLNEGALFTFLRAYSTEDTSGNSHTFQTHVVQKYTPDQETGADPEFCESRSVTFKTLIVNQHTQTVTIEANEDFITDVVYTKLEWSDSDLFADGATCDGKFLHVEIDIIGDHQDELPAKHISTSTSDYLSGTSILFVDGSDNMDAAPEGGSWKIQAQQCVADVGDCPVDGTYSLEFSLRKPSSTVILASNFVIDSVISCFADPADEENEEDVPFTPSVIWEYTDDIMPPTAIPDVNGNIPTDQTTARVVSFGRCQPDSCQVHMTLEDGSWASGFTVIARKLEADDGGGYVEAASDTTNDPTYIFNAADHAGKDVRITWDYQRNTGSRRLRVVRRLSANSAQGGLVILPYTLMEGDEATIGQGEAAATTAEGGAHTHEIDLNQIAENVTKALEVKVDGIGKKVESLREDTHTEHGEGMAGLILGSSAVVLVLVAGAMAIYNMRRGKQVEVRDTQVAQSSLKYARISRREF